MIQFNREKAREIEKETERQRETEAGVEAQKDSKTPSLFTMAENAAISSEKFLSHLGS